MATPGNPDKKPLFDFRFEDEALFEEITMQRDYERWNFRDKPLEERVKIKTLTPLRCDCPYDKATQEIYRTMQQPSDVWLDARDKFLTSSRFPQIAGEQIERFGSPLTYWREVTGRVDAPPFGPKQQSYVDHGHKYEPIARRVYERLCKVSVNEEGLRILDEAPWIYSASSDGLINNNPQVDGIIEIKCNAVRLPRDFVPDHYIAQMMGAMAVYKAPFCDFINYWARDHIDMRFLYCSRVYFNQEYWKKLKLRLDYMAWCIAYDRPPTGMGELRLLHPLPHVTTKEQIFYLGDTLLDEGRVFVPPVSEEEKKLAVEQLKEAPFDLLQEGKVYTHPKASQ